MAVTFAADGAVGTITLDNPPANSYDLQVMTEFSAAVDEAIASRTRAVIVCSASAKFFSAGADVKRFLEGDVDANMQMIRTSQAAFRRMEASETVFIAHIAGHAMGGGLEIALACHHRIVLDDGKARLGLPEVKLGLLPGGGGTQRLPRLIGIQAALPLMLEGKELRPDQARQQGIVQELVKDRAELDARARAWIAANPKPVQPWDDKKFKWPGGDSRSPAI